MAWRNLACSLAVGCCAIVAACTSTDAVLQPSALTATTGTGTASRVAALNGEVSLRFDPVVGATTEATQPLSARLASRAAETGIELVAQGSSASMMMKGFFSAISEDGTTTIIYVWDVVDPQGTRLHRIQGQQRAPAGAGQGWDAATDATMHAIADETMDQLVTWLAARRG
jgi:hypothetical protein